MTHRIEQDEFDELVTEHRSNVYGVALKVVSDPELAADVVQETFIRAWRGLERFRGDSSFGTWIHRIAINTALTARERARRVRMSSLDLAGEVAAPPTPIDHPDVRGDQLEMRRQLEEALESLPLGQRQVVLLKDVEGWSHTEIAESLGISESAAKVRLHRAHRRLAQRIDRQ